MAITLSRLFCIATGTGLLAVTLGALALTPFDLSTGDHLPHSCWAFFFAFNTWHHLLHLVTSAGLLIAARRRDHAPLGALLFGAIYVVLTPAGFADGDDAFDVIYSSWRENWVHATLAVAGVGIGLAGLRERRRAQVPARA